MVVKTYCLMEVNEKTIMPCKCLILLKRCNKIWQILCYNISFKTCCLVFHRCLFLYSSSSRIVGYLQAIRDIQYSYFKKSYLAAVSDDGGLYLWDTNSTKLLASFSSAHKAPATALAFSPLNNLLLASCGLDKKIICYDVMGHT